MIQRQYDMRRPSVTSLLSAAFAIAALVAFSFTLWLVTHEALPAAAITGLLFVVCAILIRLPDVETLEAFGGKAKLVRQQLDRAEELVATIRAASIVFAPHVYKNLAWGDRMASQPLAEKRRMIEEIDAMLKSMDVDVAQIDKMKDDILRFTAFDLRSIFESVYHSRTRSWVRDLSRASNERIQPTDDVNARGEIRAAFDADRQFLEDAQARDPKFLDVFRVGDELDEYLGRRLPGRVAPEADLTVLRGLATELGVVYRDCRAERSISSSALSTLARYGGSHGWHDKYRELFSEEPL